MRKTCSLALFLLACGTATESTQVDRNLAAEDSTSIVGGKATNILPGVGALATSSGEFCTATLIAPRVVLTAGHCVAEDWHPSKTFFVGGANSKRPDWRVPVASGREHPDFAMTDDDIVNDIAVVFLKQDAPVEPLPIAKNLDGIKGQELVFVGYGASNGTWQTGYDVKRQVTIAVSELTATTFRYDDPKHNTCNGDSGGPAFVKTGSTYEIAGVTSWGDARCREFGVDTRVDAYADFVSEAISAGH